MFLVKHGSNPKSAISLGIFTTEEKANIFLQQKLQNHSEEIHYCRSYKRVAGCETIDYGSHISFYFIIETEIYDRDDV